MSSTVADLFDAMAATYDDLEPWYEHFYARLHAILRAELGPAPAGARALDAGCGTGFQSAILTDLGWTTHGIDLSAGLLAVARQRLPRAGLAQASVEALPFVDACFDAVVCCGSTLSFVDDPARALAELGRVLRPGRPAAARLRAPSQPRPRVGAGQRRRRRSARLRRQRAGRVARGLRARRRPASLPRATACSGSSAGASSTGCSPPPGCRPVRAWGLHGVTNLLPSTVLHGARPPRGLAAAYRALCRLDAALTTTAPALAFANSLALLAIRAQPSA